MKRKKPMKEDMKLDEIIRGLVRFSMALKKETGGTVGFHMTFAPPADKLENSGPDAGAVQS